MQLIYWSVLMLIFFLLVIIFKWSNWCRTILMLFYLGGTIYLGINHYITKWYIIVLLSLVLAFYMLWNIGGIKNCIIANKYKLRKRSIVSILTKKYLIASRQVLVCDNDPAVFLTKAIDLPENSDPCHPYDLGFLTANIQNNRMV